MKLYFYILEVPYRDKSFVHFEECEVEEKPKTYTLITRPKGYCYLKEMTHLPEVFFLSLLMKQYP